MKPKGQAARFGQYWTNGTRSWTGDKEHQLWFPYGAPRVGKGAPNRWPSKQPIETPPFEYRLAFMVAGSRPVSAAEENEARELFRRRNASRLRSQKIGSFWFCEHSSVEEYASGVCALEMRDPKLVKRNGVWTQMRRPIAGEEWASRGYTVNSLPDGLMLSREERELLARILAKSPGRNRGRPPIGESAMTAAERKRRSRNQKAKASLPRGRNEPSTAVPMPLGPAVPGPSLILEIEHMVSKFLEFELAEKYHQYLGEVLDRLAAAPPSYILSREEFTIVAAAGVLGRRLLKPAAEFH